MKQYKHLYTNLTSFSEFIKANEINTEDEYLIKIFTSILSREESVDLAKSIKSIFNKSTIIGASSNGIIYNSQIINNSTLILIEKYSKQKIKKEIISIENKTPKIIAKEFVKKFEKESDSTIHLLISDSYSGAHDLVGHINHTDYRLKLAGGVLSGLNDWMGFLFDENGLYKNSILAFTLIGEKLTDARYANFSRDPVSQSYEITHAEGSIIKEIEGINSIKWIKKYLKFQDEYKSKSQFKNSKDKFLSTFLYHFIMLLDGHNDASRYMRIIKETDELALYITTIKSGTTFKIGYVNPTQIREQAYNIYNELSGKFIENIFAYVCTSRKLHLTSMLDLEFL